MSLKEEKRNGRERERRRESEEVNAEGNIRMRERRRRHFAHRCNGAVLSRLSSRDFACDKASLLLPSAFPSYSSSFSSSSLRHLSYPFAGFCHSSDDNHHPRPLLAHSSSSSSPPHSPPNPFIPRCLLTLDALLSSEGGCIRNAQKPPIRLSA